MISLKESLIIFDETIKKPQISNTGWALDVFAPSPIYLQPGCHVKLKAGFGLNLPEGIGAIISPKNSSREHFDVSPGYVIHPGYKGELDINLIYRGTAVDHVAKGEPLCQITLVHTVGIND